MHRTRPCDYQTVEGEGEGEIERERERERESESERVNKHTCN